MFDEQQALVQFQDAPVDIPGYVSCLFGCRDVQHVGVPTDVYALGVLAYELVSGVLPAMIRTEFSEILMPGNMISLAEPA